MFRQGRFVEGLYCETLIREDNRQYMRMEMDFSLRRVLFYYFLQLPTKAQPFGIFCQCNRTLLNKKVLAK